MANEQEMVTIFVNGEEVEVPKGTLVVEATKAVDLEIPVFCYHPQLEPVGMCRMCLVETGNSLNRDGTAMVDEAGNPTVQWGPKLVPACTTPVNPGMHIRTNNDRVEDAWRGTLEFLLTSHPLDCPVCDKGGECPLQDLTFAYGPDMSRFYKRNKYHFEKPIPLGELIWLDRERCIYCSRCVRFCEDVAGDPVLKFAGRNRGQEIVTDSVPPFDSYFSGNTTDICPVGALTTEDFRFKARVWELTNVPSLDPFDAVGSNIMLGTRADGIKRVMPRQNDWVNGIWISDKARFGHHFVGSSDRLTTPLIKENGEFRDATWQEALELVAARLGETVEAHGAEAIGALIGDRIANEDAFLAVKLLRDAIGTPNIDSRLHWPTGTGVEEAVAKVGLSSGSNLADLGAGTVILAIGTDLEEEQPSLYLTVRDAVQKGAQLILTQSRAVKEMHDAQMPLRIAPGSEAHFAALLLRVLFNEAKPDFGKLGGADDLYDGIMTLHPRETLNQTGLSPEAVDDVVAALGNASNLVVLLGREAVVNAGANAPALVDALVALLAASGKAGQLNSGLLPLLPHNNSQGVADMGALPSDGGATSDAMLSGEAGLRAMWIIASDPAAERAASRATLEALDFLVVQELFMTETAQLADVVLPAAAFAERDGTWTSLMRRVQRYEKALEPKGAALPDWQIVRRLAAALGADWPGCYTAQDVAAEIAKSVKAYKGMTYDALRGDPVAWTKNAFGHHIYSGTSFLNAWYGQQWATEAEGRRPKYDLATPALQEIERGDGFRVIFQNKQYDNGTLIARTELLDGRRSSGFVKMSPEDAAGLGIVWGDPVHVRVDGRDSTLPVIIDEALVRGAIVLPRQCSDVNATPALGTTAQFATVERAVEAMPA